MPCEICRFDRCCEDRADFQRRWLFSWYVREVSIECSGHRERWYHGIEGVRS